MLKNEATIDRILRIIIGLIFVYLGYTINPWLYIVAAIGIITGLTGYCALYKIFGIKTNKK